MCISYTACMKNIQLKKLFFHVCQAGNFSAIFWTQIKYRFVVKKVSALDQITFERRTECGHV